MVATDPQPVLSVPAAEAAACMAPSMVIRVGSTEDVACLAGVPIERVAWIETTVDLAERPELHGMALDVVLQDPAAEASRLYRLARQRTAAPMRVTIPALPGLGRAGGAALALGFPVRILPEGAGEEAIADLELLLDRYLHDANASAPVEFFHAALARLLHGAPGTLWEVSERDPDLFPRLPGPGEAAGFVARHVARLDAEQAECCSCPVRDWCAGYFKWPDPRYSCAGVLRVMGAIEAGAAALQRDLAQVEEMES